jgi:hypothetical protein
MNEADTVCGVCKIDSSKTKKELTKEEKGVWYASINLRVIGFLAILGGALVSVGSLIALIAPPKDGTPILVIIFTLAISIFFIYFGLSVWKYKQWCYVGGIVLYSISFVLNLLSASIVSAFFALVFLVCIAYPTSRKLFYRQL